MAFSGAGAGTIGDPFQITTASEFMEMSNYGSSVYFKLMNDIDMSSVSSPIILAFSSVLDGNGKNVFNISWVQTNNTFLFVINTNASVSNIKFYINQLNATHNIYVFNIASGASNLVFDNIYTKLSSNKKTNTFFYTGTTALGSTCTVNNIMIEGHFNKFATYDVLCDLTHIYCNVIGDSTTLIEKFLFRYCTSNISYVYCSFFNFIINTYLLGDRVNVDSTLNQISIVILNTGCNAKYFYPFNRIYDGVSVNDVSISSDYLFDLRNNPFNSQVGLFGTVMSGASISNVLFKINKYELYFDYLLNSGQIFNNYGHDDWYLPSIDELSLIYDIRTNALFDDAIRLNWGTFSTSYFRPMSSSEHSSSLVKVKLSSGTFNFSKNPTSANDLFSVILVRNIFGIIDKSVGDEHDDTVIIYKNGNIGIGAAKEPLFAGINFFNYNTEDRLLGTSDSVGSGYANTQLIINSETNNQTWLNWATFEMLLSLTPISLIKTGTGNPSVSNSYYNIKNNESFLPIVDSQNVEEELSDIELLDEDSFNDWDFVDVWEMGSESPYLKNLNTSLLKLPLILINEVVKLSSTSFNVKLITFNVNVDYGIDIIENDSILDYEENSNDVTFSISGDTDRTLLIKTYYIDSETSEKVYIESYEYYHYYNDQQSIETISITEQNTIIELRKLNTNYPANSDYIDLMANLIHGSILYDGYIYGSPRNSDAWGTYRGMSSIAKINVADYSNFDLLEIEAHKGDEYDETVIWNFEQIVRIDKYLFTFGTRQTTDLPESPIPNGEYLVMINTDTFDYKIFRINFGTSSVPLISDGQYLFIGSSNGTQKVNPSIFINSPNKYYVSSEFEIPNLYQNGWYYDNDLQGGHVDFPKNDYDRYSRGRIHSGQADAEYLYLSHTTTNNSGYYPDFMVDGKGICELQVVRKSDMTPAGWCFIPRSTDDMCQTIDWLFFGIEVLPGSDPDCYGYGWGAYAVKKSDVIGIDHSSGYVDVVKGLPPLHDTDHVPGTVLDIQSYASLIFGDYLLDLKTNKVLYILDISDVENWSLDEPIGNRTLKAIKFNIGGTLNYSGITNEAMIDETGVFHSFLWKTPSGIFKYEISGLSFFLPPTMQTLPAVVNAKSATLSGYILNDNGKEVTEAGIELSDSSDPETFIQFEYTGKSPSYDILFENLVSKTYYFRAYAINEEGTGYGEIKQFTISGGTLGYIAGASIVKGIIGGVEITSVL